MAARALQLRDAMHPALSLACTHSTWLPLPGLQRSYAMTLVLLVVGFVLWRWIRPSPSLLLRRVIVWTSAVAFVTTVAQTLLVLDGHADDQGILILRASLAVTGCVYFAIITTVLARRRARRITVPLAKALPRGALRKPT